MAKGGVLMDLKEAKSLLEVQHSGDDDMIARMISNAEGELEDYIEVPLLQEDYTERFDGGSDSFLLEKFPIDRSSVEIVDNNKTPSDDSDNVTIDSKKYAIYDQQGYIEKRDGLWDPGLNRFEVSYTAGLEFHRDWNQSAKETLHSTIRDLVKLYYENRDPSKSREGLGGGHTRTRKVTDIPPRIKRKWDRFAPVA